VAIPFNRALVAVISVAGCVAAYGIECWAGAANARKRSAAAAADRINREYRRKNKYCDKPSVFE